jgi:ferredoxin--NADP+ reductase
MLLLPHAELAATDTADHALAALDASAIREVVVVARRGPEQAAFTNPELLELGELTGADVIVDPADLAVAEALPDPAADGTARRNMDIMREYAARDPHGHPRRVVLRFLSSPAEIRGDGRVQEIELVRNALRVADDGSLRAVATDERSTLSAGLVLRAIGYRGRPLADVPFDEHRGVIPNEGGRVREREYVVGWAKRGPSGVIGTNKKDANETVDALLADLAAGALPQPPQPCSDEEIEAFVRERQPELVTFAGWEEIDRHEQSLGEPHGRPRVKLTRIEHMLGAAGLWPKRD